MKGKLSIVSSHTPNHTMSSLPTKKRQSESATKQTEAKEVSSQQTSKEKGTTKGKITGESQTQKKRKRKENEKRAMSMPKKTKKKISSSRKDEQKSSSSATGSKAKATPSPESLASMESPSIESNKKEDTKQDRMRSRKNPSSSSQKKKNKRQRRKLKEKQKQRQQSAIDEAVRTATAALEQEKLKLQAERKKWEDGTHPELIQKQRKSLHTQPTSSPSSRQEQQQVSSAAGSEAVSIPRAESTATLAQIIMYNIMIDIVGDITREFAKVNQSRRKIQNLDNGVYKARAAIPTALDTLDIIKNRIFKAFFKAEATIARAEADTAGHGSIVGAPSINEGFGIKKPPPPSKEKRFSKYKLSKVDMPNYITVDSGAACSTGTTATHGVDRRTDPEGITIISATGHKRKSIAMDKYDLPMLPVEARGYRVFKKGDLSACFSVGEACDAGCEVRFQKHCCTFYKDGKVILEVPRDPQSRLWLIHPEIHKRNELVSENDIGNDKPSVNVGPAAAKPNSDEKVDTIRIDVVAGPYEGKYYELQPTSRSPAWVGRLSASDSQDLGISLPKDPMVSVIHGWFCYRDGRFYYFDPGSFNGTDINGDCCECRKQYELKPKGMIITVGQTAMKVTLLRRNEK